MNIRIGTAFIAELIKVQAFLEHFNAMWNVSLGQIDATDHSTALRPYVKPVHKIHYSAGAVACVVVRRDIDRLRAASVVEPVNSECTCTDVFVLKRDGSLGFCIHYCRLNTIIIRDAYPVLLLDDCLYSRGVATVFLTLGSNSGYWYAPITPEDRGKPHLLRTMVNYASRACRSE